MVFSDFIAPFISLKNFPDFNIIMYDPTVLYTYIVTEKYQDTRSRTVWLEKLYNVVRKSERNVVPGRNC